MGLVPRDAAPGRSASSRSAAQARADRYTYLPLIGVVLALVWLVDDLWPRGAAPRRTLACLLAGALAALSGSTLVQAGRWRDTLTLLQHTERVTKDNYAILNIIGAELLAAGRVDEAIEILERTVRVNPDLYDAHYSLGNAYSRAGRYQDALEHYARTLDRIQRTPDVRSRLGYTCLRLNLLAEAERYFRELQRLDPGSKDAQIGLMIVMERRRGG